MRIPDYANKLRKEVQKSDYVPSIDGRTFCNLFVREVSAWHGWNNFNTQQTDQAGEMVKLISNHPQWHFVDVPNAQFCANRGNLVIAGMIEQSAHATGHVCIIMPGTLGFSFKWMSRVPMCANVGKTNFTDKTTNWAFKSRPGMWVWSGSFV